jgi:hypothetical protein
MTSLILNLSTQTMKETMTQYQREQAMLWAKSYIQYAIMASHENNQTHTYHCIDTIHGMIGKPEIAKGYKIEVHLSYIGNDKEINLCHQGLHSDIHTNKPIILIIDVYVRYKEIEKNYAQWVTYHQRSSKKITL